MNPIKALYFHPHIKSRNFAKMTVWQ